MPERIAYEGQVQAAAPSPVRILGLGGSMRANSHSLAVLKAALAMGQKAGADTVLADIRVLDLPVYNPDWQLDSYPETLARLLEDARRADGYILCSPTYHGTVTGSLKNTLDALEFLGRDTPPYFAGKLVGLIAVGGGAQNVINSLLHTARTLNGLVVPTAVAVPHGAVDGDTGLVTDTAIQHRLQSMMDQLIDYAVRLKR